MSVTITFYTVAEKRPEHGQEIIWLRKTSSFGYDGFYPRHIVVEYSWDDGEGCSCGYSPEDGDTLEGFNLRVLFDGEYAEESDLWLDVEEYWKCFMPT